MSDVSSNKLLTQWFEAELWVVLVLMYERDVFCQRAVGVNIGRIQQQEHEIKTGQQGLV